MSRCRRSISWLQQRRNQLTTLAIPRVSFSWLKLLSFFAVSTPRIPIARSRCRLFKTLSCPLHQLCLQLLGAFVSGIGLLTHLTPTSYWMRLDRTLRPRRRSLSSSHIFHRMRMGSVQLPHSFCQQKSLCESRLHFSSTACTSRRSSPLHVPSADLSQLGLNTSVHLDAFHANAHRRILDEIVADESSGLDSSRAE